MKTSQIRCWRVEVGWFWKVDADGNGLGDEGNCSGGGVIKRLAQGNWHTHRMSPFGFWSCLFCCRSWFFFFRTERSFGLQKSQANEMGLPLFGRPTSQVCVNCNKMFVIAMQSATAAAAASENCLPAFLLSAGIWDRSRCHKQTYIQWTEW